MGKRWRTTTTVKMNARELRKHATPEEKLLWYYIADRQLAGAYFRRQHAVGPYVLDFYCSEIHLAIELDGSVHLQQQVYDQQRTEWLLNVKGIRVIRFSDGSVRDNLTSVLQEIEEAIRQFREKGTG